jgi:hypothetical protein
MPDPTMLLRLDMTTGHEYTHPITSEMLTNRSLSWVALAWSHTPMKRWSGPMPLSSGPVSTVQWMPTSWEYLLEEI